MRVQWLILVVVLHGTTLACAVAAARSGAQGSPKPTETAPAAPVQSEMKLGSDAFKSGEAFPVKFTADGAGTSPPLRWDAAPAGVKSFAILMDDPDARGFVHWTLWGIPATARSLPEALPRDLELKEPAGVRQGQTSWGRERCGYWGSAPPPGSGVHHYTFTLFALDVAVDLAPGATAKDFRKAIKGHVLAEAKLVGLYERKEGKP
jgi:Raf kinase inhibitor-like YbhB/YbcL family protein